jgi:hypothetical protein
MTKRPTPAHKEPHFFKKGAGVLNDRNLRGGQYTARKKRGLFVDPAARIGFAGERGTE